MFKAGAPSPGFESEGMRAEWEPVWKPEQYESESKVANWKRWEAAARADSKPIPTSSKPND
eukprot:3003855-Pyramimonas_sp.AAC.1